MARKQQLGIELQLSLDSKFGDLVKQIENAFSKVDLKGFEAKIAGTEKKVANLAQEIAKVVNGDAKKIQLSINNSDLAKQMNDAVTLATKTGNAIRDVNGKVVTSLKSSMEHGSQITAIIKNTNKAYTDLGNQIQAINKNTEAANKAFISSMVSRGQSILAIERNTNKALVEERKRALQQLAALKMDRQIETKQGSDFLAGLSKQGLKIYNGDIVPKTYVTDVNKAHAAAIQYNNSIKELSTNVRHAGAEAKKSTGLFDLFGISLGRMSIALTAFYAIRGVLFTIRNQIRDAVGTLLDFNQALYDTAAISGSSVSSLKEMEQAAFNLATTSRFTVNEIMQITKILAQAGVASKDLAEATKITTMFATGANATPAQAVDLMTTAMNVWDIQATDSIRIANTLTATLNASKLEAGGLSTAFNYLANQGAQMNMSLEETSGIIATLSNVGVKPSTIGTGASGLLAAFAAPAPRFAALLKEFKVGLEEVNPMTHTFAEIIGRLERAAIPTEAILGSLDKRIARTLVSALNAGQQGFELMTRAVTGTDAALIANFKVMDGARAKMNVVKAEFVQAMKEIGNAANGAFSAGLTVVRTFILSITTEGGKAAIQLGLVAAALTTVHAAIRATAIETSVLSKAILALKAVNPEVWVLVGALTAVTAALAYFGNQKLKQKEQSEAFSKAIANEADKLQQAEVGVIGLLNSMDKSQKTKNGYIKLTADQTKELVKLINTYPEHLGNLDLENLKMEDLIDATNRLYEARKKNASQVASEFNRHGANINTREGYLRNDADFKKVLAFAKSKGMAVDDSDPAKLLRDVESYFKNSNSLTDRNSYMKTIIERLMGKSIFGQGKAVTDVEEIEKSKAFQDANNTALGGHYLIRNRLAVAAPEVATTRGKSGASDWQPPQSRTAQERQENLDERTQSYINGLKQQLAKLSVEEKKIKLAQAKEDLKTDHDLVQFKMLSEELIQEEANQKKIEIRTRLNKELADKLKGTATLDAEGNGTVTADPKIKASLEKELRELSKKAMEAEFKNVDLQAARDKDALGNVMLPHQRSGVTYNSDKAEKSADKLLQITTQRLNLEKEMAATAEEVRQIEIKTIDAQILNTQQKAEAYRTELASIENANILEADMQVTVARYEVIQEKLEEIVALEAEWTRQKSEQENVGFWHNFEMGAKRAVVALGDFKSNAQSLGENISNTALNGMVDLLDQSITKIAQMEWSWKSFRETLGNILGDIGKELTKYYAKLLVIMAVQKVIGFIGGSGGEGGGSPMVSSTSSGSYTLGANGLSASKFANGGLVTGGIQGVDSVPIIAAPSEYVVRADVVKSLGVDFMDRLNSGAIKKFANGGLVGGGSSSGSGGGLVGNIQIVNVVDPSQIPQTTDSQIINVINMDIAKRGPTIRNIKMALA